MNTDPSFGRNFLKKNFLESQEIDFKNGIIFIQPAGYNGLRMVQCDIGFFWYEPKKAYFSKLTFPVMDELKIDKNAKISLVNDLVLNWS